MKLTGDPTGIEELKKLKEKNVEYLKFLLQEARTNTDLITTFKGENGIKYVLQFKPHEGTFEVKEEGK